MTRLALVLIAAIVSGATCQANLSTSPLSVITDLLFIVPAAFLLGIVGESLRDRSYRTAGWIASGLAIGPLLGGIVWSVFLTVSELRTYRPGPPEPPEYSLGAMLTTFLVYVVITVAVFAVVGFFAAWLGCEFAEYRASRAHHRADNLPPYP